MSVVGATTSVFGMNRGACAARWLIVAGSVAVLALVVLYVAFPKKGRSGLIMVVEQFGERFERPCAPDPTVVDPDARSIKSSAPSLELDWPPAVIAHAGGGIRGLTYTNSLEAMDLSFSEGCSSIEVDLEFTSDGKLVLLHDWGAAARLLDPLLAGQQITYEAFLSAKRAGGLSPMGENELLSWLEAHPGATVVLDSKRRSVEMMRRIYQLADPSIRPQLVAQAYQLDQVAELQAVGFAKIVLTLYRFEGTDEQLLTYLGQSPPLAAVTMPSDLAFGPLAKKVAATGFPVFTHPINSRFLARLLKRRNIGVYSSTLCSCSSDL